jgi:hypothetical protein
LPLGNKGLEGHVRLGFGLVVADAKPLQVALPVKGFVLGREDERGNVIHIPAHRFDFADFAQPVCLVLNPKLDPRRNGGVIILADPFWNVPAHIRSFTID